MTTLPTSTIEELGIHVIMNAPVYKVSTAGGIIMANQVEVESINLSGCIVKNLKVIVLDLPEAPGKALLGMNFLKHFKFEINHKKGILVMSPKDGETDMTSVEGQL